MSKFDPLDYASEDDGSDDVGDENDDAEDEIPAAAGEGAPDLVCAPGTSRRHLVAS